MTSPDNPLHEQAHIPHQPAQPQPAQAEPTTAPPRRPKRRLWIALAVAVVLIAAGVGAFLALRPTDEDEALDRCQSAITEKLKSPSTAKFGEPTVTSSDGSFGSYFEVSGQVDAQNGFGAMVRGDYRCKVTLEKDGRWLVTESSVAQG